jgi:small-conductance mechanosensitive channel
VRWLGPLLAIDLAVPLLTLPVEILEGLRESVLVGVIGGLGWLAVRVVSVVETVVVRRVNVSLADNLHARAVYTQMRGMRNVASFIVVVITVAFALMSFERVRHLGTGLLASAGLAGLALGFAAQKSLAAVLAGIQIAVTQPIRVDDVVIVEGEWGKIEEITLTYVVVKVWDLRRLIVPVEYFIDKPFQNWTRTQASLLGTVELHLDYSGSVEVVRREFKRILDQSERWDRQTWGVQVTDATERTMLVRLLMSANSAGTAFDLRCDVREKIIDFLQRAYPDWLPRLRGEVTTR